MGAQRGSGPRRRPAETVRRVVVRVSFTEPEARDLVRVAEAWGVPVGTAIYGLAAEALARARRKAPAYPRGLAEALARYLAEAAAS